MSSGKTLRVVDFKTLEAAVEAANKQTPCLLEFPAGDFDWPKGLRVRSGVSMCGVAGPYYGAGDGGTRLFGAEVIQADGDPYFTRYQTIQFMAGLDIRKQHTLLDTVLIAGAGLGYNRSGGGSPYNCAAINTHVTCDPGQTALTLATGTNGAHLDVSIRVTSGSRAVQFQPGTNCNRVEASIDFLAAEAISSFVLDEGRSNHYVGVYHELRHNKAYTDGARFVIGLTAQRSTIEVLDGVDTVLVQRSNGHRIIGPPNVAGVGNY